MRRIRQISASPAAAASSSRLATALAVSAGLHVILIYGFVLPAGPDARTRWNVIPARLQPAPRLAVVGARPQRAPASTPLGSPSPETVPDTPPRLLAAPAQQMPTAAADAAPEAAPVAPFPASEPGGLALADPVHYPAQELDVYPRAITPIAPDYPPEAAAEQRAGSVTLKVLIDDAGRVVDTTVLDATAGAMFAQAAVQAVARAAFHPARKAGRAVRSQIMIEVEFDSTGESPAR